MVDPAHAYNVGRSHAEGGVPNFECAISYTLFLRCPSKVESTQFKDAIKVPITKLVSQNSVCNRAIGVYKLLPYAEGGGADQLLPL